MIKSKSGERKIIAVVNIIFSLCLGIFTVYSIPLWIQGAIEPIKITTRVIVVCAVLLWLMLVVNIAFSVYILKVSLQEQNNEQKEVSNTTDELSVNDGKQQIEVKGYTDKVPFFEYVGGYK